MKIRVDELLVKRGLVDSKKEALTYIMLGDVYIEEVRIYTAGEKVREDSNIWIKNRKHRYVSRGGDKLEKAINLYDLNLEGKVIMDIGASTGGFTDCMLKNGAKKVYALDVGYGQLDWRLRKDPRVIVMERTNIRNIDLEILGEPLDFASIDVSFISLKLVLPVLKEILKKDGEAVALIKPQFEAHRDEVGEGGIIRDKEVHSIVLERTTNFILDLGFKIGGLTYSPITGTEGNIEFLVLISKGGNNAAYDINSIVEDAHKNLS